MDILKKLKMDKDKYKEYVKGYSPKSSVPIECAKAFLVGGLICVIGEGVSMLASDVLLLDKDKASAFTAIVMVFLGSLLTGLGVYDVIGKFAGAGSIVPITGFANSIVSPAMEFKREGFIVGVGAKLFTIAGGVLVYGISASILVGLVFFVLKTICAVI